ncbi:beta-microseminoprotein-like [Mytilus galloprovincialis]|uniref:beta-microseminoprotein-like n=1 Tax=Mytilus galloprovincialis TaxID=29158 RepID=UPI003F7B67C4
MRAFVLLCILSVSFRLCTGACFMIQQKGCYYDKIGFLIPSKGSVTVWTPDCVDCACGATGIDCCSTAGRPTEFPDDCEIVMDGCYARVVKKKDHTIECPIFAMVG